MAVVALVMEHARNSGGPTLQRFVELKTRHFANANTRKLQELLGCFDRDWQVALDSFIVDELKSALDSVVALRNRIAHGESVGVTYSQISNYYVRAQKVIERIAALCVP